VTPRREGRIIERKIFPQGRRLSCGKGGGPEICKPLKKGQEKEGGGGCRHLGKKKKTAAREISPFNETKRDGILPGQRKKGKARLWKEWRGKEGFPSPLRECGDGEGRGTKGEKVRRTENGQMREKGCGSGEKKKRGEKGGEGKRVQEKG